MAQLATKIQEYKSKPIKPVHIIVFFLCLSYFLISLTALLIPKYILALYPFFKSFTDFMSFIPAISVIEQKSFAPELAKFYASYMFLIGIIYFFINLYLAIIDRSKRVLEYTNYFLKHKYKVPLSIAFMLLMPSFLLYLYFIGDMIGHSKYRSSDEYFIHSMFELIVLDMNYYQGFFICFGTPWIMISGITNIYVVYKHFKGKINERRENKKAIK